MLCFAQARSVLHWSQCSELFHMFCRKGSPGSGGHFFVVNGCSVLFRKLMTFLFISLMITLQDRDPCLSMASVLNLVPYRYVTLTSHTGTIFVFSRIHPFGVDLSSLRGDVYSRPDPAYPIPIKPTSWNRQELLTTRNISHKTNNFASFTHSSVIWKIFECFVVTPQQVSLYWMR